MIYSSFRLAPARRQLTLAAGAAMLAVVAPGLAQIARAQAPLPALPPLPSTSSASKSVAPAMSSALTPIPFKVPTPRTIKVSKINAANAFPFVNAAATALAAGDTAQALALYRRAYQLDPTNEYAAPGVATALLIQGKFDDAAQTFRNHLVTNPDDAKTLRGLADSLTYAHKYREALGVNNYILQSDSRNFAALYQNAQIATYAGDYKLSETYFNRASGVDKSNPEFWASWGESLSYRHNPRALNAFGRALQLKPDDTRAKLGIANYYVYTSQFDKAIAPLQTVLAADPNNVEALISLGNALTYTKQPGDAVAYYQKALALKPDDINARLGLGRALVFAGQNAQGATELRRVLDADPNNREALEALAVAQNKTAPSQALQTYQALLGRTTDPDKRASIYASMGDLQLGANDLTAAASSYQQAAQLAPSNADINLSYAQILGYNDDYASAGPIVERVLAMQPRNPRALALQVEVASKTGDSARATQLAAALRDITPATAQEALAVADALRDAGDPKAATALLVRASGLSSDPALGLRIANATRDNGDYTGSVELYNRLLRVDPNDISARVNLARALYYSNNLDEATKQIDQVLQLDAQNQDALLVRAEVLLAGDTEQGRTEASRIATDLLAGGDNAAASTIVGEVLTSRQQFAGAIEQFRKVLQLDPNNLQAQLGLARNLYYARQVEDSISEYQKLIGETPADTLPRLELAQIFLDRNRLSEAEVLFNEVLTLQQRGVAALPAARRASERGQLARLHPDSLRNSILRDKSLAKLASGAVNDATALHIVTVALAQVKPKSDAKMRDDRAARADADTHVNTSMRLAQAASPTVGVGGEPGTAAPPAASFPTGPAAPVAPIDAGADAATATPPDDAFVPTAPIPPSDAPRGRTIVPRVPTGAGEAPFFTTPLAPGATVNSSTSDQVKAYTGLGEVRLRQGRFAEALELFSQALQLDANDPPARIGAARSLRGQGNFTGALSEIDRALQVAPSSLRARVLRAQLLADTGQSAAAQTELDNLIGSLPEDAPLDTILTLVEALNSLKNYTASLQLLDVATQLYPREPAPLRLQAETLNFAGRYDDSLKIYDQLIAADPQDSDAVLGKARVYNYSNRLPLAETTYRQVLAAQPDNYQAATELASVLGRRGNYPEAIQLYALAIQGNPSDLATRVELARVQRYAGRDADAEATLTQVLDSDARNVSALTERGILRGAQGSYAPAIADLQQALEIAPQNPTALLGLAQVQGYAKQYPQSIAGYRAVLATDPTNEKARTELGQVLSYSGDDAGALRELDAVLATNPTNLTALLTKADVLGRSNRTVEAVQIYNSVLTADPRNARARSGLADTYVNSRRYADAIKIYDQLIAAEPGNTTYQIARARALGYNRQYVPASNALRKIIAAEPDNLAARLAFAEVGTNSGNASLRNGAIAEYRRIVAADASNVPARVGLARALSYQGQTKEAEATLKTVLATEPNNVPARVALGEAQRFAGDPFGARDSYNAALKAEPGNVGAQAGLNSTFRLTHPSIGVSGSYYNDTNGVRLKSLNFGPTLRTRGGIISVIAEQGRFEQGPYRANRSNIGLSYAKAFGPIQAVAAVSRLKYSGVSEKFLYDLALTNSSVERRRYFLGTGRRDVYESAQAVAQGITATTYRGGFNVPLGSRLDFETQGVYYRYSDDNSRYSILPALYYRFRPTNPSLRVGLGYTYDDTDKLRNIYYTPQNYSAFAALADYSKVVGKTRFGFNAAVPLTNSTGKNGVNRPANTLFGFINRDVGKSLELFANGGIVRSPDFHSDQITFGGNLWF